VKRGIENPQEGKNTQYGGAFEGEKTVQTGNPSNTKQPTPQKWVGAALGKRGLRLWHKNFRETGMHSDRQYIGPVKTKRQTQQPLKRETDTSV